MNERPAACDHGLEEPGQRPESPEQGEGVLGMATGSVIPQPGSSNPSAAWDYADVYDGPWYVFREPRDEHRLAVKSGHFTIFTASDYFDGGGPLEERLDFICATVNAALKGSAGDAAASGMRLASGEETSVPLARRPCLDGGKPEEGASRERPAAKRQESRPRLLDLFCGAGGAAMGYHRAGFDVVGVDIKPQPHYPFEFVQADALEYVETAISYARKQFNWRDGALLGFDVIHASPPCQAYTRAGALRTVRIDHPDLIGPTRELLKATGLPYVIENVPGSPLYGAVQLCGTSFGLGWSDWELQRHRWFEATFPLRPTGCFHSLPAISVVGHGATKATRERLGRNPKIAEKRAAMGIDWMNRDELSEAIPPIYTEYVGNWMMEEVRSRVAA